MGLGLEERTVAKELTDEAGHFWGRAFSRNIGLLTTREMGALRRARVAIAGLGGMGGCHLLTLARTGVGKFHLAEFDAFELHNMNRQAGARVTSLGKKKIDVLIEDVLNVNPFLEIKKFPEGVTDENRDDFLAGVDVVLDALDAFALDARRRLFNRAREKGIPVVTAGPLGFGAAVVVFTPEGMGFDQYFDIHDGMSEEEKLISFFTGLSPKLPHLRYMDRKSVNLLAHRGPSLGLACQLAAGLAAVDAIRLITGRGKVRAAPAYLTVDPYTSLYHRGRLWFGNGSPWRRLYRKAAVWFLKRGQNANAAEPQESSTQEGERCESL